MKTARTYAHDAGINYDHGDRCGRSHIEECNDATRAIRAAQIDALKWAGRMAQLRASPEDFRFVNDYTVMLARHIAELEAESLRPGGGI